MDIPLIATKFHIPFWNESNILRPRLLDLLDIGLKENRKLSLISSPAGYGKTSLIASWLRYLADDKYQTLWLSLDDSDNDQTRFMYYLLAGFSRLGGDLADRIQTVLNLAQLPPSQIILSELINELSKSTKTTILILDDYHLIINSQIHEILENLIEHQPSQLHLVLVTRQDPPLQLGRLRAHREMTEIRARELRFAKDEAHQFFINTMKIELSDEITQAVEERTEGWIAGLQLAGLAFQNIKDPFRFIESFRGSHQYVLDYLAEEVISQQSDDVKKFLTTTCILERFSSDVCNYLTDRCDSQQIISYLDKSNLFVIPLDDERSWFRFHPLFTDYLRILVEKNDYFNINKKAAEWFAKNNLMEEAVRYALASQDLEFAGEIVEKALLYDATWSAGDITRLSAWLDALPIHILKNRPHLSIHASRVFYLAGRFDRAEKCIADAEQAAQLNPDISSSQEILALAALYRGAIASVRGELAKAFEQTNSALEQLPPENHLAHARGYFSLGLAYELSGKLDLAAEHYHKSSSRAITAGVLFLSVHALCSESQVYLAQGKLTKAAEICRIAIDLAGENRIPPTGLARIILGSIELEGNNIQAGESYLTDGISLARKGGLVDDIVVGQLYLGRLYLTMGKFDRAQSEIDEAAALIQIFGVSRMNRLVAAISARINLLMGRIENTNEWVNSYQKIRTTNPQPFEELTLARYFLVSGKFGEISDMLPILQNTANQKIRVDIAIEAMILLGLYYYEINLINDAEQWIINSLKIAIPEGYIRIFLDEGKIMLNLLKQIRRKEPELVDKVLRSEKFEADKQGSELQKLPDPLSEQEIRVLRLIVMGKSNQEIASELVISVGTAKWHVHNILQKLGVNNRPQAIARARELSL